MELQPGSLEPIKQEIEEYLYNNQQISIKNSADYSKAGDIRKQLKNKIKIVEEKRKDYTQPLDEAKKRIMEDFKGITKPLEEFIARLDVEMLSWHQAEQKRLNAEQARIEKEALEQAKKNNVSEVVVPVVNEIKTTRTSIATTSVVKRWTFRVLDVTQIPREYLMLDERLVNEAIRKGERKIPGIEIYQEEKIGSR